MPATGCSAISHKPGTSDDGLDLVLTVFHLGPTGERNMITSDDVRSNAERYFEALQRFDLDEVVRCFAEDAFYSHPSYDEDGGQREEARGRDGIAAMLRIRRGDRPTVQEIHNCINEGDIAFLEGTAYDRHDPMTVMASWVSSVRVASNGLFKSYANYVSSPPVGSVQRSGLPSWGRTASA